MPTPQNGQIHWNNLSANCLSVFDHFVKLPFKVLNQHRRFFAAIRSRIFGDSNSHKTLHFRLFCTKKKKKKNRLKEISTQSYMMILQRQCNNFPIFCSCWDCVLGLSIFPSNLFTRKIPFKIYEPLTLTPTVSTVNFCFLLDRHDTKNAERSLFEK